MKKPPKIYPPMHPDEAGVMGFCSRRAYVLQVCHNAGIQIVPTTATKFAVLAVEFYAAPCLASFEAAAAAALAPDFEREGELERRRPEKNLREALELFEGTIKLYERKIYESAKRRRNE